MKVIGRDIGGTLDVMYGQLERRVQTEAERPLQTEAFTGGSFSNVEWREDAVVIQLHSGVPTHALPHVFGVALQHIRQRLDLYPRVIAPVRQLQSGPLLRSALRELVMGPEAEMHLEPLKLDMEWEVEQRHQGLKDLLRDSTDEWDKVNRLPAAVRRSSKPSRRAGGARLAPASNRSWRPVTCSACRSTPRSRIASAGNCSSRGPSERAVPSVIRRACQPPAARPSPPQSDRPSPRVQPSRNGRHSWYRARYGAYIAAGWVDG
jgi:hypothetical protein